MARISFHTYKKSNQYLTHHYLVIALALVLLTYQIFHSFELTELNNSVSQQAAYYHRDGYIRYVPPIPVFQLPPTVEEAWSKVKLVIFMTTHLSKEQLKFLPCWKDAVQRMPIFKNADLMLYTTKRPNKKILSMLPFRNTIIKLYKNTGYQNGALQAMKDPFLLLKKNETTWFDAYDWVIRVNLDVLIRYDAWLIETMLNKSIDGIFHDCKDYRYPEHGLFWQLHTDFHAFRPSAINPVAFLGEDHNNAERHASIGFRSIYDSGRFAFVKGGVNPFPGECRIEGLYSPVLHDHTFSKACPFYYNYTFY